jgi:hypothetical protein
MEIKHVVLSVKTLHLTLFMLKVKIEPSMLSVVILNVVTLKVVMLSVVRVSFC